MRDERKMGIIAFFFYLVETDESQCNAMHDERERERWTESLLG
jgi:hypothetical protein